jgi:hypothetical protein
LTWIEIALVGYAILGVLVVEEGIANGWPHNSMDLSLPYAKLACYIVAVGGFLLWPLVVWLGIRGNMRKR